MENWDIKNKGVDLLGENGIQLTQGLFYEFKPDTCIYTLSNRDKEARGTTYPSLPQIYMRSTDEYEAAMNLVGNMDHWRKLCGLKWFMEGIPERGFYGLKQLREDMKARDASEAKRQLLKVSKEGSVPASRYLHEVSVRNSGTKKDDGSSDKESKVIELLESARRSTGS